MLTSIQIESLRAKVSAAQARPMQSPWKRARFVDRPLGGLAFKTSADAAENPKAIVSWCEITERGPVLACYRPTSDGWKFDGYDAPGARASGMMATA